MNQEVSGSRELTESFNDLGKVTLTPANFAWQRRTQAGKYLRFIPIAQAMAQMSKNAGTKVGAIVLGKRYEVLASGWNGAPRGCKADEDERFTGDRETRLQWTVHAEANAIANAAASGAKLDGGTMLTTLMPCMTCAKLIVQSGIVRVICPTPGEDNARWAAEFDLTRQLFRECGVVLLEI
jgi:dCMP deaminase